MWVLRLDKNDATDGDGKTVGNDGSLSPRVSAIWDPTGGGVWALSGSFARYTMALTSNLAASTAKAGMRRRSGGCIPVLRSTRTSQTPHRRRPPTRTEAAVRQMFAWHDELGGDRRPTQLASVPGVSMTIDAPADFALRD